MTINNDLPDKKFPMEFKHGEEPDTEFGSHLEHIKVKLLAYPTMAQLCRYIPEMALATWEDKPRNDYTDKEREQCVQDLFEGKLLPTTMETVGLTFLVSNIDLIDVTHLIRHRTMSFSAHCTGDRDQRHDPCMAKESIIMSKYFMRYMEIVEEAKQLYADMLDDKDQDISILDARTILPRSLANHYYARVNLKDLLHYLGQRLDRQIQPESDNIVAMRMLLEVAKVYPGIKNCIDLDKPDTWYIKTAQTDHSSNLYMPEDRNDIFEHKPQWFVYKKKRSEMLGGSSFVSIWNNLVEEYNSL